MIPMVVKAEETINFSKRRLRLGTVTLTVEVADSDARRARGLMFRHDLPEDHGMFFLFDEERDLSFWMKNTFIPLSIGYFNRKKELIKIVDMKPVKSEMDREVPSYPSGAPAQYALEVSQGWFQRHKVAVGTRWQWEDTPAKAKKTD
jgi:uncharacterized membrane protein (UPF0127 family)